MPFWVNSSLFSVRLVRNRTDGHIRFYWIPPEMCASMPIRPAHMCWAQFVRKRRAVWREHFCHKLLKLAGCYWHGVVYLANVIAFFLHEGFRWFGEIVCPVDWSLLSVFVFFFFSFFINAFRKAHTRMCLRERNFFLRSLCT